MRKVSNKVQPIKKPKPKVKKAPPKTKSKSAERLLYEKYLRSEQFAEVKRIVRERAGNRCEFCGRTEAECMDEHLFLSCHHISYENLGKGGQEEANDCRCVCNRCHFNLHHIKANIGRFVDKHKIVENWKRE